MTPHLDSRRFIEAGRSPGVAVAATCGIALYLAYHLTRFDLSSVWPPSLRGDAGIDFLKGQSIFAEHVYPTDAIFPFSPSAVLIFRALGCVGPVVFMAVWYALMVSGLVVTVRGALAQEPCEVRAAWPLIGTVAILCADAPISWDLRNANSNLICLGLVMAGYVVLSRRPALAGALVGLSVSLKPYSALVLPWVLLNGQRRVAGGAAATLVVLRAVLPVALFGIDGTVRLYQGWVQQLKTISDPAVHASLVATENAAPIVTLQRAVINLSGWTFGSAATYGWLAALWAIWTAALAWYGWRCRTGFPVAAPSRAALADWIVVLLAPLPFSPWLEPYHFVPLLAGALLCTAVALDEKAASSDRTAALAALLLLIAVKVPFRGRGLGLCSQILVFVLVLGFLRPRLATKNGNPSARPSHRSPEQPADIPEHGTRSVMRLSLTALLPRKKVR